MNLKQLLFLSILFASSIVNGQNRGSIYGLFSDKISHERIPFANIAIHDLKTSTLTKSISDEHGNFKIDNLALGEYKVICSFIGYKSDTLSVTLSVQHPSKNLGNIHLEPSAIALKEAMVTGSLNTQTTKIDRKVYKTSDFETAKGGTAADLLNKLPSVSVSPDGEVSVRGTTDFMVYLNGKPTQLDPSILLGQIAGSTIENIEIISVPTAKYDAQGKGGIININTKTSGVDGLSIALTGSLGGSPWNNLRDPFTNYLMKDDRYTGGLNLLYGKGKLTLFGGINYSMKNVNGDRVGDARILDPTTGAYKHMYATGERPEWYENFGLNGGFDYSLSKATQLSGSYFYGQRTEGRSAFYLYHNFYGDKDKNPVAGVPVDDKWIYNPNTDTRYGKFHSVNLDLKHKFNDRNSVATTLLYEHSSLSRALQNENFDYNSTNQTVGTKSLEYKQTDETPLDALRLTIDYAHSFENGGKLGFGLQPQWMKIAGDFQYDTLNISNQTMQPYSSLENGISLHRNIYAGYIDYTKSWNKLNLMVGVRAEYTDQALNIDNPNYFSIFNRPASSLYKVNQLDLFPTLNSTFDINPDNKLTLAANRRISRPAAKDMAPFLYRRHLEVYVVGDPALKPEYINNIELGYERRLGKQKINLTGFYRGVDNALFRVNTVYNKEMVLIRSVTNSGNSSSIGAELNANLEAGKIAKFFVGGSLYQYHIKGEAFGYEEDNKSLNWTLKGNANLMLTKELKLSADFDMKSATVTAQGNNFLFYTVNAAMSYTPTKLKNWNFSLRMLDILNSNDEGLDTRAYNSKGTEIFYQKTHYYRTGTIAELGISYIFSKGNSKSKSKVESTFGKSEF